MRSFQHFREQQEIRAHKNLNAKFFDVKTKKMRPEVRKQLLKIGAHWAEWCDIPPSAIIRYDVVGGNAGYLYNSKSDLDLHIICDLDKISECEDLLREFLRSKKKIWQLEQNVTIYGTEVEIYAEDKDDPRPNLQARYDVSANKWVTEPDNTKIPEIDDIAIQTKAELYVDRIEDMIDDGVSNEGVLQKLKDRVLNLRKGSLQTGSEFAFENLVYKAIRNSGSLDRLDKYMRGLTDSNLSLYK